MFCPNAMIANLCALPVHGKGRHKIVAAHASSKLATEQHKSIERLLQFSMLRMGAPEDREPQKFEQMLLSIRSHWKTPAIVSGPCRAL